MPCVVFIRLEPYPARYARHLPHAGKAFRFFPDPSSWAVDNSLCEIIFARKEEEWVEGSPRKAATFDGDTENILAWFIFTCSCCIRRSGRRIWLFSSISAWILPQKIEKRGLKKSNETLWKKCAIVSYFRRKNKAERLYRTQDGVGVTIYQSKDCILKTLFDLQFLERSCRIKSWAEDASVCKSKPGGDSDFGILMRKESYGEPTDGEDRSAEGSKAIGQAKMMWTFLSKPAQGPIHVNPITPEKSNLTAHFPAAWEGVPRR